MTNISPTELEACIRVFKILENVEPKRRMKKFTTVITKLFLPIMATVFVFVAAMAGFGYYQADRIALNITESNLENILATMQKIDTGRNLVKSEVQSTIDVKNIAIVNAVAEIIVQNTSMSNQLYLLDLCKVLNVSEIHLINEEGILDGGTVEELYGFDFNTADQTKEFTPIINNPSIEIVQSP